MLKEAIACFNAKKYSESKRLFENYLEQEISSIEKVDALTYLQEIYKLLHQEFPRKFVLSLILELDTSESEKIMTLFENSEVSKNISAKQKYFEATYKLGMIEKSLSISKEICFDLVEQKAYSIALGIFDNIENKFKGRLYYEFGRLIVNLEMADFKTSLVVVDKLMDKILNRWPSIAGKRKTQVEYAQHIFSIVENFSVDELTFRKSFLLWKMKFSNQFNEYKLTNKEKMEAVVIFFDAPEHYYLLINILTDEFIGYELLDYLKKNEIKDTHNYKKRSFLRAENKNIQPQSKTNEIDLEVKGMIHNVKNSEIQAIYKKYQLDADKTYEIDKRDFKMADLKESIVALVFIEDFKNAKNLLRHLDNGLEKNSLEIEILRKSKDYLGLCAFCTELFQSGSGEDDLWLIENIIWGFEQNGNLVQAENFRSLLMGYSLTPSEIERALHNEES